MKWTRTLATVHTATPQQMWTVLADVPGWPRWDYDLVTVTVDGPAAAGVTGRLRPTGWLVGRLHARFASPFRLIECVEPRSIVVDQPIPAGVMRIEFHLEPASAGTVLRQRLSLTGPLRRVMALVIGRRIARHAAARARRIESQWGEALASTPSS